MGTTPRDTPTDDLIRRAEAGDVRACVQVGNYYAQTDRARAMKYYSIGVKENDPACMFGLAAVHINAGEDVQGISLLQAAAARKHLRSLVTLGDFYLRGRHVSMDPRTAFLYLQEYTTLCCARPPAGDAIIVRWDLVLYPLCLLLGVGCTKDERTAFSTLRRLGELGNLSAQRILMTGQLDDPTIGDRFGLGIREAGAVRLFDPPQRKASGGGHLPVLWEPQQRIVAGPDNHRRSGFLEKALIPDEKILLVGVFPRIYTLEAFLWPSVMSWLGLKACHVIPKYVEAVLWRALPRATVEETILPLLKLSSQHPFALLWAFSFVGVWVFLSMMIRMWTTHIVLTDRRFIFKRGLVSVEMIQMNFWQIEHTDVNQSILGTILDYGRVVVQSYAIHQEEDKTGNAGLLRLPHIRNPYMFTRVIEDHRRAPPYGNRQNLGGGVFSFIQ